ncbi:proline iminopeptidase [Aeriscardovia aeriphila]|uniref:Proline iminopeptidase n=2 Tax=Aeriscardovia aeriphila TaxID=218139 RepID=A0A261F9Q2_9BIFI|nr:proline iminopeptidase [Aeriscardovia aeriphila]OZG55887.1 proline iminopeptidase [Aeriscardovia aeriphila]
MSAVTTFNAAPTQAGGRMVASYMVPGLYVEDHEIAVPLDWRGVDINDPAQVLAARDSRSLTLFYRVVTAAQNRHRDVPTLVFLQGGPGGKSPRPESVDSVAWISEAAKNFRIVLPDQRGTGRSSSVSGSVIERVGAVGFHGLSGAQAQADYLQRFFADSIVRDFEWVRRADFGARKWVTLGQSYGGFLTLTYLSLFPEALVASFTTGGIPAVPAQAEELYRHTYEKLQLKINTFYERYPQDKEILARIAARVARGDVKLPNGDILSVKRLQSLGSSFGMKPSFEQLHWLLDDAFDADGNLSTQFLQGVFARTTSYGDELYWTLQEGIYQDGSDSGRCEPTNWAAQRVLNEHADLYAPQHDPLMFTGEMALPWMFEEDSALKPFAQAEQLLQASTNWGKIYDENQLAHNEVPLTSAVYFEDMYVPQELSLRTLSHIPNSQAWVTNSYQHDGVRETSSVFAHLLELASARGALEELGM